MSRSVEGPARSLLNSFTVATTPPPRPAAETRQDGPSPTADAPHIRDEAQYNTKASNSSGSSSSRHTKGGASAPNGAVAATGAAEESDEEPQPSFIAPQPVPVPSSSLDASVDRSATMAPPRLVSATWQQSLWRPSVRYGGAGVGSATNTTPFTWRPSTEEAPVRTPAWRSHSLRSATEGKGLREQAAERGGLTPKIRYRSESASAPRASAASSPSPPASSGVRRHSPVQQQPQTSFHATPQRTLDIERGRQPASWETSSASKSWLPSREHNAAFASLLAPAVPQTSDLAAWLPPPTVANAFDAAAAVGQGSKGGAGPVSLLRPPPALVGIRQGTSEAISGAFTAGGSTMTDTRSDFVSGPNSAAPPALWQMPAYEQRAAAPAGRSGLGNATRGTPRASATDVWTPQPPAHAAAIVTEGNDAVNHRGGTSQVLQPPISEAFDAPADPFQLSHLTLRSLTEEYNHFSLEGTVSWVGLQVHLRRHTHATQITALDLTCYRMQRDQWSWFTLEILPQLQSLETLRLVQMGLNDEEVAELVRGCCGLCTNTHASRTSLPSSAKRGSPRPARSLSPAGLASSPVDGAHPPPAAAAASGASSPTRAASLQLLRVLDLSGNAITQRSCNHLGKMLLWMADSLEEVRLLGNPLKDYGMQTLAIYLSKMNVESLREDPELFPGTLRHHYRLLQDGGRAAALSQRDRKPGEEKEERTAALQALAELPLGPVLLDLRDCRASARGLSDILAAASRTHRLRVVLLSHNVAGVTSLLPLPPTAYQEALDVATNEPGAEDGGNSGRPQQTGTYRLGPAPRRLRLAKTPLILSGALMRRQHAAFSDVRGFATSCPLSTIVFHSVPLSQTCSPVGCRELLLNIFFSCPLLDLVDLSDTFEWSLVPPQEQQRLVAEANRRDAVEQRLRGPAVQRGLHMYLEDQGEVEFVLDTATVAGQTRVGDIFCELMAHASHNAVVRQRVVPAAFAHLRELDLSKTGLTDAGARGLCVSVRRGRARTGMLASLTVLNLSDNLLTARGCVRVLSSFLLEDIAEDSAVATGPESTKKTAAQPSMAIAHLTALALQRNAGVEGAEDEDRDVDSISGYITDGTIEGNAQTELTGSGGTRAPSSNTRECNAYLSEVCTAAEAAVLRRATLRSAARGSTEAEAPPLTLYFSAPPARTLGSGSSTSGSGGGGVGSQQHTNSGRGRGLSVHGGSTSVFYAGCDESGDVFCTCPRSRFYVPKSEVGRVVGGGPQSESHADASTSHLADQPPLHEPFLSTVTFADGVPPQRRRATPPASPLPSGAQRTLFSTVDAPRAPPAHPRSQLQLQHPASSATTPDVRLPHRPSINSVVGGVADDASGLVQSGPLHPLMSSLSFPPPPSILSRSAETLRTGHQPNEEGDQQQQQQAAVQRLALAAQQPSRRGSLVSVTGASLGSLFMDKAPPSHGLRAVEADGGPNSSREAISINNSNVGDTGRSREDVEVGGGHAAATSGVATAGENEFAGGDVEKDNLNSSTAHSGKRRAKARQIRTFVLSYDHPAGHLLCRALGVLLRPAPDALGEGARAALAQDLLSALQRACARATAYPDGDESNHEGGGAVSPRGGGGAASPAAVVVESVRYLAPVLSNAADIAEAHWMRFEMTTNERKARMAQRLQEVLNVSWAAQCVRFASLLQWLRAHVMERSVKGKASSRDSSGAGVVEWDPVQAVERAARASPAVRARLDALYAGSAAAAVHANHFGVEEEGDEVFGREVVDDTSCLASLAQLHPRLWKEMGLAADAHVEVPRSGVVLNQLLTSPNSQTSGAGSKLGAAVVLNPQGAEEGDDMYSAISASEDESRRSQYEKKEKGDGASGSAMSPVETLSLTKSPQSLPVVDLYAGGTDAQRGITNIAKSVNAAGVSEGRAGDAAAAAPSSHLSPPAATNSSPIEGHFGSTKEAEVKARSVSPAAASVESNAARAAVPAVQSSSVGGAFSTLRSQRIRRFEELTDSDGEDMEERGTTSAGTPEKQMRGQDRLQRAEAPSSPTPQLFKVKSAEEPPKAAEVPQAEQAQQPSEIKPHKIVSPTQPPAAHREDDAVLTDQLLGPSSPSDEVRSRKRTCAVTPAAELKKAIPVKDAEEGNAAVPAAATSRPHRGEQASIVRSGKELQPEGGSLGSSPESRGKDGTQSDSPSSLGSRQRVVSAKDGGISSLALPSSLSAAAIVAAKAEAEYDAPVVSSPVRVRRRPSELEGRVKTFTLSYTHQEGTAVCRAWRLLHSAMVSDTASAEARSPTSPTSPTSASLAQEARDCLCDDFLALLQPPDEDRKHAVLSVTLHGDSGAATAMLQVQVQTNERRATLANRLQESNHGVRRGASSGGRGGNMVPLTVEQSDRFYFPRLTRLLRRHQLAADTVAQIETYLASRLAVQSRLVKSYGSIGSVVHYYHGSTTALEHELGITSWRDLTVGATPPSLSTPAEVSPGAETRGNGLEATASIDVTSPTMANDRVMLEGDTTGVEDGDVRSNGTGRASGNDRMGGGEATPRAISSPETRKSGSGHNAKLNPAPTTSLLQGRPPPHPRRPRTPPNPITHTSSISFDEVTEEPTSEAGPVVVLRGSTPSVAARSPSTPNTRNPQYYPAGFNSTTNNNSSSATGVGERHSLRLSESRERDRRGDADSDPGALSPLTSASASPAMTRRSSLSPPPHTQLTLEGSKFAMKGVNMQASPRESETAAAAAAAASLTPTSPSPQMPPRNLRGNAGAPEPPQRFPHALDLLPPQDRRGALSSPASNANLSRQVSGSSAGHSGADRGRTDYERVLEGKYKRLMRVAYDGVALGSVPLEPQHQQKTVIGRGKWGTQKVELSLEWEILFVLTFEKSRTLGRSSRRAQMIVHPVGFGFECASGDEVGHQSNETSSLHSSMVNAITAEGSGAFHPPGTTASQISKASRGKRDSAKSAASHLIISIQRPFSPNEVGSSSSDIEKTLMAGALLTVTSPTTLSKAARLLGGGGSSNGGDDASNTSRGSAGTHQVAQETVYQLCQRSLTLDIEMKSAKHVQEALRLLKNSIRRATQAVRKSMSNAHVSAPPPFAQ